MRIVKHAGVLLVGLLSVNAAATEMVVRVDLSDASTAQVEKFLKTHPDILGRGKGWADVLTTAAKLTALDEIGLRSQITLPDVRAYEAELRSTDYIDYFYDYQEILTEIQQVERDYPAIAELHDIGDSWEKTQGIADRDIWAVKISDNVEAFEREEPEVLIMGNLHAREIITPQITMFLIHYLVSNYGTDPRVTRLIDERQIWLIPTCNPDGLDYVHQTDMWWRKNRRDNGDGTYGVDLNRNFGYMWGCDDDGSSPDTWSNTYRGTGPFSEPETQAIRDLVEAHTSVISLSYHSYGDLWLFPWGYISANTPDHPTFVAIAESCVAHNGYWAGNGASGAIYTTNGDSDDWFYGEQSTKYKVFGFTPEVGATFHPDTSEVQTLILENLGPNLYVIEAVEEYSPRPVIEHDPLPDSEDLAGPYHVVTTITSPVWPLDESSPMVHCWWEGAEFDSVGLTATGQPDEWEAWVPGSGARGAYGYYFSASDSIPRTGYAPPGAPGSLYTFMVGPDTVPPVLWDLTQLGPAIATTEPRWIQVLVSDNLAVDLTSGVLHCLARDGGGEVPLVFQEWADGQAQMGSFLGPVGSIGDTVFYFCSIADSAALANTGYSDTLWYFLGLEDFESGLSNWDTGAGWDLTKPAVAHSGEWVVTDSPQGPYDNNADNSLTLTSGLGLESCARASISFWAKYALEENHDYCHLEASRDGTDWTTLLSLTGRSLTAWSKQEASLDGFAGPGCNAVLLRFHLVSDAEGTDAGVYIDDVLLETDLILAAELPATHPREPALAVRPNPSHEAVIFELPWLRPQLEPMVSVYDLKGRLVRALKGRAGEKTLHWDGRDRAGRPVPAGMYYARVRDGHHQVRLIVIR